MTDLTKLSAEQLPCQLRFGLNRVAVSHIDVLGEPDALNKKEPFTVKETTRR